MRIRVLTEKCQGHARCAAQSPDIFKLDDNGFVLPEDIDVPPGQERAAWRGAKSCPERALLIEDE
jgi:ferredoxin